MLDPLPLLGLGLLAADELGNPDRRRHLGGEPLKELSVVGGVRLVGEPAAQVEHPDELSLADERDHQLDTCFSQFRHRWRVEAEPLQFDGRTRRLQVGKQRVVWSNVDLDRLRRRRLQLLRLGLGRRTTLADA